MGVLNCVLLLGFLAVTGASPEERIVGGPETTIDRYPFAALLLLSFHSTWHQSCGGSIINNRSVLSAAHCFVPSQINRLRIRSESSFASRGGKLHNIDRVLNHPNYNPAILDSDIAIVRVTTAFGGISRPAAIAGHDYNVADNQAVWVIGWGLISQSGPPSEQLRHVEVRTANQNTCRTHYPHLTDNMLCAGWIGGGRGPCRLDSGGPLLHNNVVIGIVSYSHECAHPIEPSVYARVSRHTSWIEDNA